MGDLEQQTKALAEGDCYPQPEHGWTCFHCGETFTTPGAARTHFGFEPSADAGCIVKLGAERGLLMALRKVEGELTEAWDAIHQESTEAAKAYYAQQTRHRAQLMAAEEAGYERGLADAATALSEAERMREALVEIANPIAKMQEQAEAEGARLDGMMAQAIANDPNHLKSIARAAIDGQ